MRRFLILPLLALWACSAEKSAVPAATASAAIPGATATASASAEPLGEARSVKVSNDLFEFEYAYPAQVAAIPALKSMLDADITRQQAELRKQSKTEQAEAASSDFPYRPHSLYYDWKVVAETPSWLSLSSLVGSYTGGAHPNYWFSAILWDKAADKERKASELFTSKQALTDAIRKPFCGELNRQRSKKRGLTVDPASKDMFDECIDPVAETVILGSSNGQAFNRIGILVPPYEAGPYAEGDYEVTLPITPAVLAAVKPEYRAGFSAK
jgi:hypothetical protein